ncbi:MAG: methyltransferase domain-containing protein [Bacteroidia bacterium]|nr:methyltransferase domain-containing protein [Bacteroidia bacterium]
MEKDNAMTKKKSHQIKDDEDIIIKSQMERMVNSYDLYMKRITLGREDALRTMTVNLAQVKPGNCVLEIGCATGTLSLAAKRQAGPTGSVFGIDIIPGMIEVSQKKAIKAKLDVTFQLGNIEVIPFPNEYFDVVICSFMIFHMSEKVRNKGVEEIYRVLKPQGRLMVLDLALPSRPVSRMIIKLLLGFVIKHDLKELQPVMESSGFSQIEISQVKYRILGLPVLSFVLGIK